MRNRYYKKNDIRKKCDGFRSYEPGVTHKLTFIVMQGSVDTLVILLNKDALTPAENINVVAVSPQTVPKRPSSSYSSPSLGQRKSGHITPAQQPTKKDKRKSGKKKYCSLTRTALTIFRDKKKKDKVEKHEKSSGFFGLMKKNKAKPTEEFKNHLKNDLGIDVQPEDNVVANLYQYSINSQTSEAFQGTEIPIFYEIPISPILIYQQRQQRSWKKEK